MKDRAFVIGELMLYSVSADGGKTATEEWLLRNEAEYLRDECGCEVIPVFKVCKENNA